MTAHSGIEAFPLPQDTEIAEVTEVTEVTEKKG